ncbi:MAG TPA: metallophosphoesterase, partial [Polyangiaceae bacterium]
ISFVASAVLVSFGGVLARVCLPAVAKTRAAKVAFIALVFVVCAAHVAWVRAPFSIAYSGATIASVVLCLLPFAVASVPIAAIFRGVAKVALPASAKTVTRRAALGAATAIAPIALVSAGISGFTSATAPPRIPRIRFAWRKLHPKLHGVRILHLSDLHLGVEKHVEDLEALFDHLKDDRPDLVVFTGDVAENLRELGPALDATIRFAPRLGVYASLGNHEYLHDASAAARIYAQKNVPLLVSSGTRVTSELFIAGADDPVYIDRDPTSFLASSIDSALEGAPPDAFRLLMCHRPEGFVPASACGVHLTLAGHTHGGQIGFNGKSAFEPIWRDKYLWGRYSRGASGLYTTSGFGHWFPFRLMCPTEAPIIELVTA